MSGTLCWNCKYLAVCRQVRSCVEKCSKFEVSRPVNQNTIATWLGCSKNQLRHILGKYGKEEVVERLMNIGILVYYERVNKYDRFYETASSR